MWGIASRTLASGMSTLSPLNSAYSLMEAAPPSDRILHTATLVPTQQDQKERAILTPQHRNQSLQECLFHPRHNKRGCNPPTRLNVPIDSLEREGIPTSGRFQEEFQTRLHKRVLQKVSNPALCSECIPIRGRKHRIVRGI